MINSDIMKPRFYLVIFFVALLLGRSCIKPGNGPITGGGKGGHATITVTPQHHGFFIDTCTIYIKYNAVDVPANGIYDDSARCILSDTIPIATFSGLIIGNYYLFGIGYHATYSPPNVKGGQSCTVSKDNTTTNVYLQTSTY